jgi:glutathione S-transferase
MITLHGFAVSNYYNKVKLALLEKGVPFLEKYAGVKNQDALHLAASPLGKIPYIETEDGFLCESQPILEYLEATYPQPPLLPKDPYAAAKVRELATFIDWHLEITTRQLYPCAFFGAGPLDDATSSRLRKEVEQRITAFKRLARFAPYVAGENFTMADCSAFADLPLVGMATKAVFGEDLLAAAGVDYKSYLKLVGERGSAIQVVADRKAAQAK